jgi:uncharacterized protein YbbC (DUF1343 family)
MSEGVRPGLEALIEDRQGLLRGSRTGLLAHAASVDRHLRHAADLLGRPSGPGLTRIFGPEHGVTGAAQDMAAVSSTATAEALDVVSLYGATEDSLRPPPGSLDDLDVVVVDLQDVGARYYTYAATAAYLAEACSRAGVRVVVADRPNPLGGHHVEGNRIERGFGSFVGQFSVPQRHGLTLGELLLWARTRENWDLELEVVPAEGWRRDQGFDATRLPWVLPSPNLPTLDTARVYPGACLFEGTNLSEGRGTARPFELVGAPFLDGHALASALEASALPGTTLRPCVFRPTSGKWADADCGGVQIHVDDPEAFRPLRTGLAVVATARRLGGGDFAWRRETYEFVSDIPAFDLLAGTDAWRRALDEGAAADDIAASWRSQEREWLEEREPFLLY